MKVVYIIPIKMLSVLRNYYLNVVGSFRVPSKTTHILNLHYVTKKPFDVDQKAIFEQFLVYLSKIGNLISMDQALANLKSERKLYDRPEITLTFDDGFEECFHIIAPLLEKFNTLGTFFVNSNYVDSSSEYQNYFNERIKTFTKKPMSWQQIKALHLRGHTIGSHTSDHKNLAEINLGELNRQIIDDKKKIESELDHECNHFAWPYGTMSHYTYEVHELVKKNFKYVFSSANYKYSLTDYQIINRRHIEPFWNKSHINYFLSHEKKHNLKMSVFK
ncbi:MAG: polysaccharide deacetylase family protein [Nonlabens sp.]